MGTRAGGAAIAALALLLAGCTSGPTADTRTDTDVELTLVAFDSCADTLAALRKAAVRERAWERSYSKPAQDGAARGTMPEAPVPAAPDSSLTGAEKHSGTNNHESGVDEADLVKTDGKRIVMVVDGTLRVVDASTRRLTSTLNLTAALKNRGAYPSQLLLHGSRALVIARGVYGGGMPLPPEGAGSKPILPYPEHPISTLLQVELDGGARVVGSLSVDGVYVDARQVGPVARVVMKSGPRVPNAYGIADSAKVEQENLRRIAESTEEQWLPRYELDSGGRTQKGRVPCDHVVRPTEFSGTSMLTIYSLDLGTSLTDGDPLTVVADGDTVYASEKSLYVAHQADLWRARGRATTERTELHQFDISESGRPQHVASGAVPGTLLNQYAMSEHDGHLRVATTRMRSQTTESTVYVLASREKSLAQVGSVGGLGKDESIHAVRFAGDRGYVVTFRQTDPVYTLDLRDPQRPRVTGELKINGYSAYLHPVDDKTLIGVGQDATGDGRRLGTQISVFDVADPTTPRRVAQHRLPSSSSEAEFDPHAFLYWPKDGLIVVPVNGHSNVAFDSPYPTPSGNALVLSWRRGALTERGTVAHPARSAGDSSIRRSLVIGETLWTVSAAGVRASRIADLSELDWIPFQ